MTPLARKENLVVQKSGDELLVYDLKTNKVVCLNETTILIWQNCDGSKSIKDLQKIVENRFGELVSEDFVKFAIDQLKKENLLNNKEEVVTGFNGMSRRDVIKRIGFTSMVALPIIASITAPVAVMAGSCAVGAMCSCAMVGNPGDTCGNGNGVMACPPGCTTCTIFDMAMGTCS